MGNRGRTAGIYTPRRGDFEIDGLGKMAHSEDRGSRRLENLVTWFRYFNFTQGKHLFYFPERPRLDEIYHNL